MPARSGASKHGQRLIKKHTNPPKPQARSLGAGYAHVIHRPFPTDWGQFRSVTVTAKPRVMAQGFHPCRLQRSVPGFPTELSTGRPGRRMLARPLLEQAGISSTGTYCSKNDQTYAGYVIRGLQRAATMFSTASLTRFVDKSAGHGNKDLSPLCIQALERVRQVVHMPSQASNVLLSGVNPRHQCPPRYALRTSSLTNSSCPVPVMRICPLTIT